MGQTLKLNNMDKKEQIQNLRNEAKTTFIKLYKLERKTMQSGSDISAHDLKAAAIAWEKSHHKYEKKVWELL
jgi:hypothetical protein